MSWHLTFAAMLTITATASAAEVPNPDFTAGADAPAGWKLSGGEGRWVDRQYLEVTGNGKGSNNWSCACRFEPGAVYRFEMRARAVKGTGCVTSGPSFANYDWQLTPEWKDYSFVFRVPDNADKAQVRVGQWEANGTFQFDRVRIVPLLPVVLDSTSVPTPVRNPLLPWAPVSFAGPAAMGDGESVSQGRYRFAGTFSGQHGNYHHLLARATATFNTDRWCINGEQEVVYLFRRRGVRWADVHVEIAANYHARGNCAVDVDSFNKTVRLATIDRVGTFAGVVPDCSGEYSLLRIRGLSKDTSLQVNRIDIAAIELADNRTKSSPRAADEIGRTLFATVDRPSDKLAIDNICLLKADASKLRVFASKKGDSDLGVTLSGRIVPEQGKPVDVPSTSAQLDGGRPAGFDLTLPTLPPGKSTLEMTLSAPGLQPTTASIPIDVPELHRSDYGQQIVGATGERAAVWACDATRKIGRQRPAPTETAPAAVMSAAKNDREAVQIVVRPNEPLKGLIAVPSDLKTANGTTIPASQMKVLRVAYHFVHHPTDATGVVDWWPDALPPIMRPLEVPAGLNQPLWVLVHVPKDAAAGDYTGTLSLEAEGWSARVPLKLHVWNFALPDRNHIETAFGLSPETVFKYHNLKTEEDKRLVLDHYLKSFAEHRISPYDPVPLDHIRVKLLPEADPPRAEFDFTRFDAAMQRAMDRYKFSNFMLHLQGMGGGTFHERFEPMIGKYGADTPQYRKTFASYMEQLQSHLAEKGWLDMAYTYWFDEPDPKDYAFVRAGMERIKRHAPKLTNMLTEEPNEKLGAAIDIWCPVTNNYRHDDATQRRAAGNRIWWYVCCGPKAPYCTLFIDHPATELRAWLWQTWQRDIAGILIWSANYWHSETAFPDTMQNPYDDPMGYVVGYGVPKGSKQFWGNGDGRFVYPPEAASTPGRNGGKPILDPPASSIRWEMLREGIEDWEYLYLLRELLAKRSAAGKELKALVEVPESITRDMTTFTTDPTPIYARRQAVAEAIEKLMDAGK